MATCKKRTFLQALVALPWAVRSAIPAIPTQHEPVDSRYAVAHDGTKIPIEVYGRGPHWLLLGPYTATVRSSNEEQERARRAFLDQLADRYRVVLFDYPGAPKPDTLTPEAVARDYLTVADAAGADRFAYCGYSWGAVTGLQLAIRTDRLSALICGGFPMIDGPYDVVLTMAKRFAATSQEPARYRQFITYYEPLQGFNDRAVQHLITCPRLCFVGTSDDIVMQGEKLGSISTPVIHSRAELVRLGWNLELLEGRNHQTAADASIVAPLVRSWLGSHLPATGLAP